MQDREELLKEQNHLDKIREHIADRLEKTHEDMDDTREGIMTQRLFLWENYAENVRDFSADEMELSRAMNSLSLRQTGARTLRRLYPAPFFARLDYKEDGEEKEQLYIGPAGLYDDDTYETYIYDWRTPIASMYYDHELGRASYISPRGKEEGEISLKRQFKIENGKIIGMFDSSVAIQDQMLIEILSKGAQEKMGSIAQTIQREQNAVIRNESGALIVQGAAGSGKTSVALHRVAYLLYQRAKKLSADNVIIFSPNSIFSDYISEVLPSLDEQNVWQTGFDSLVSGILGKELHIERSQDFLENIYDDSLSDIRMKNIYEKFSYEYLNSLESFAQRVNESFSDFADIKLLGEIIISKEDFSDIFSRSKDILPAQSRLERVKALFDERERDGRKDRLKKMEEYLDETSEDYTFLSREELKSEARRQYFIHVDEARKKVYDKATLSAVSLYKQFLKEYFVKISPNEDRRFEKTLKDGRMFFEDAPAIVFLMAMLGQVKPVPGIRHVVVDEAQDYSFIHYRILKHMYKYADFTVLGDENQRLNPFLPRFPLKKLTEVFGEKSNYMELPRSYRSTSEISEYAASLLGNELDSIERHGEPVILTSADDMESIISHIKDFFESIESEKMSCIITRSLRSAILLSVALPKELGFKMIGNSKDDEIGERMIMPIYLSKGLEFDNVAVLTDKNSGDKYEYVAATRATSRLMVIDTDII
ncbi:MAG: UvrD-helicase domain-containing protein [Clostridia bacterium]|nr:UvrD-helicase domain-containing protein [Clostridia bacterium]